MSNLDEAVKTGAPESSCADVDVIMSAIEQIKSYRRQQTVISVVGIVALIAIILLFMSNLYNFAKGYDHDALNNALADQGRNFIQSASTQAIITSAVNDFKSKFLPAYTEGLRAKLEAEGPALEASIKQELDKTAQHLENSIHSKLENRLLVAADAVQKDISEKFAAKGIDAAVTEAAVNQFIENFKMMSADKLEQYLQAPLQSLAELYADFEALENSSEYKQLSGKSQDEIESMLIEALLVRCVYEVNPDHKF